MSPSRTDQNRGERQRYPPRLDAQNEEDTTSASAKNVAYASQAGSPIDIKNLAVPGRVRVRSM